MSHTDFFFQAFIYLLAACISVPLAKRIGLGSVLGYLLAGIIIGPFVLKLVGYNTNNVMQFAEFGIVMMLFLIGLELRPSILWQLRTQLFGMGLLQIVGTTIAITALGLLWHLHFAMALAIGMILSSSSTAIVMQTMTEKSWLQTDAGKASFSVLLFQDIAVIPMLAILPLLASIKSVNATPINNEHFFFALTGWQRGLLITAIIIAIVVIGRFLVRPIFRFIAQTKLRETFTAVALLLVVAITLAMQAVGLSPALGAFLAGVVLAENEYRHELESDIEPFKGLLLGLFFISVGASINFKFIFSHPFIILSLIALLMVVKFLVLLLVGKVFKLSTRDNLLFACALPQGGEFCFVLFAYATQNHIIPATISNSLIAVVALSMLLTPLFIMFYEKFLEPHFIHDEVKRQPDVIEPKENAVVIAGFGRFGQIVGRLLTANGIKTTVLDLDSQHIELLRRIGFKVYYGDASRLELLQAAKLDQAKLFILAIDDDEKSLEIAQNIRKLYPHLKLLIRVKGRTQAYEFIQLGFDSVYRETFGTALQMATDALISLGFTAEQALHAVKVFQNHDERSLRYLAKFQGSKRAYISEVRKNLLNLEETLNADRGEPIKNDTAKDT